MSKKKDTQDQDEAPIELDTVNSREERRATGRMVAVIVALLLILLAMYHAWVRRTAVLAGVIVPALIMILYTAWILYSAKKDKKRRFQNNATLADVFVMAQPKPSTTPKEEVPPVTINESKQKAAGASTSRLVEGDIKKMPSTPRLSSNSINKCSSNDRGPGPDSGTSKQLHQQSNHHQNRTRQFGVVGANNVNTGNSKIKQENKLIQSGNQVNIKRNKLTTNRNNIKQLSNINNPIADVHKSLLNKQQHQLPYSSSHLMPPIQLVRCNSIS